MANPVAGWYQDPSGDPTKLRWWDGTQWTDNYADAQPAQAAAQQSYQQTPYQDPAAQPTYAQPTYAQTQHGQTQAVNSTDQTLRLIAFILCILSAISVCWAIIPLAWMIPMTIHCWKLYKGEKVNTVAFGVCTLLFVNIISGILLLVSTKEEQ